MGLWVQIAKLPKETLRQFFSERIVSAIEKERQDF